MSESSELKISVDKLIEIEKKNVSLAWSMYRGIFYGLGFFIGGTLLVAFILYVLSFFDTAPVVGDYVSHVLKFTSLPK